MATGPAHSRARRLCPKSGRFERAVALLLILPIVLASLFGGSSILSHSHHGHGSHWHIAPSRDHANLVAALHQGLHHAGPLSDSALCPSASDHDRPSDPHTAPEPDAPREGALITLPDHDQSLTRAGPLLTAPANDHAFILVRWALAPVTLPTRAGPEPAGAPPNSPPHLATLRPADRLLRTSRALLI